MSSFQIDLLKNFRLDAACISNITPDHLDRYDSFRDYILSKKRIAGFVKGTLIAEKNDWNVYFSDIENILLLIPLLQNILY